VREGRREEGGVGRSGKEREGRDCPVAFFVHLSLNEYVMEFLQKFYKERRSLKVRIFF
jgi:hypothetical protein